MEQTKLTPEQKQALAYMKAYNDGTQVAAVGNDRTTIAWQDQGKTVQFSLAEKSDTEKKYRRKVGEFLALDRLYRGECVSMEREDFMNMCAHAWDFYPLD